MDEPEADLDATNVTEPDVNDGITESTYQEESSSLPPSVLQLLGLSTSAFTCEKCGSNFKHESKYLAHLLIHEEKNIHKCPCCEKIFSKSSNLTSHMLIHTGNRTFLK